MMGKKGFFFFLKQTTAWFEQGKWKKKIFFAGSFIALVKGRKVCWVLLGIAFSYFVSCDQHSYSLKLDLSPFSRGGIWGSEKLNSSTDWRCGRTARTWAYVCLFDSKSCAPFTICSLIPQVFLLSLCKSAVDLNPDCQGLVHLSTKISSSFVL